MAKKYNPQAKGSVEESKKMYADIGLCYGCGREKDKCSCEAVEKAEREYSRNMPAWVTDVKDVFDALQGDERAAFEILLGVDDTWTDAEHQAALDVAAFMLEPGTAEAAASAMLIGAPTWEFPWSDKEVASEEMNHRPEVGF